MTPFTGSSPHTRGAHVPVAPGRSLSGIIPAYAGSTGGFLSRSAFPQDHPRIRGEHADGVLTRMSIGGSSPHTRGAPGRRREASGPEGIIPAYAGSTASSPRRASRSPDHPRIRGEHSLPCGASTNGTGSSPHTRGAPPRKPPPVVGGRIIPAYAGSTIALSNMSRRDQDHPRIRGEHRAIAVQLVDNLGSSPHTRGARRTGWLMVDDGRIIPAYAGSTRFWQFLATRSRDHPRIRGEHTVAQSASGHGSGSSPHTRGAPQIVP